MKITNEGALLLSLGIVKQVGEDYINTYKFRTGECNEFGRGELEKFFTSEWCEQLTNIDGRYIMNEIKKKIKNREIIV